MRKFFLTAEEGSCDNCDDKNDILKNEKDKHDNTDVTIINNTIYFNCSINEKSRMELYKCMNYVDTELKIIDEYLRGTDFVTPLHININSPGGYITDSFSIYDRFKNYHRPIIVTIDGYAASGASIISCGATKVLSTQNSYFMIHEISSITWGKYSDFKDDMKFQDDIMNKIYTIYSEKTKMTKDKVKELFERKDLWMNSEEAMSYGFIDEIIK